MVLKQKSDTFEISGTVTETNDTSLTVITANHNSYDIQLPESQKTLLQ